MARQDASPPVDDPAGPGLAVTLGLIALFFLPLMGGGYSSGGAFQTAFVLLPLAAALAWWFCHRRPPLALIVLLIYSLGVLVLPWWVQGGRELWYYLLALPAAWIATWVMLNQVPARARWLWPVVTGGALVVAVYAWALWAVTGRLGYQLIGTFGLHNAFAGYLLLAWPAALIALLAEERKLWRWAYALSAVLLVATLVLTYSRAAWLTLLLQLFALAGWALWRRLAGQPAVERVAGISAGAIAAVCLGLLFLPPVQAALARLLDFQGYSFQGRLRFWQAALEIFRDHPWLGVGPGNFAFVYPQYQLDYIYYSVDPHSWVLQLLSELGLFGLLIVLAVIAGTGWWIRRLWRATGGSAIAIVLIVAVVGSLLHAAVDFDYTFASTTALLGVLLAYGTYLVTSKTAPPGPEEPEPHKAPLRERIIVTLTVALLVIAGVAGEMLTLERYQLDHLRDYPNLDPAIKLDLLEQALRYNRFDHKTHYQLASILGQPGAKGDKQAALEQLDTCLQLNPRYAPAWALRGLLADDPAQGNADLEHALELDPYNYPEHYYIYANLAPDDAEKRRRLLLGLERIPAHHPIKPDHVRPTWHELNPMWAEWYYELARLTDDEAEKQLYRERGAAFQAYWESVLAARAGENGK
ncbi:O-antigen ligase family protein [bacterium]|nr:O-antigen ligase family protein [bacterium]